MIIQNTTTPPAGKFFIEDSQQELAALEYTLGKNNQMVIQHTEVDESLQGKNIGEALVDRAVEYARQNNLLIIPACSFAAKVFKRNPGYNDVLLKPE